MTRSSVAAAVPQPILGGQSHSAPVTAVEPTLGLRCLVGDVGDAVDAVIERARSGRGGVVCFANVHVAMTAQQDPAVRDALKGAWLVLPDGAPIAWSLRRRHSAAKRVAGPEFFPATLDRGRAFGLRHFLFGSTPYVLADLEQRIHQLFRGVDIAGTCAPARGLESESRIIERIAAADPDVIWVALGAPKQELWAARHHASLAPALVIGVGAAFDFISGHKPRAPLWMQEQGLEWLHRLMHEPRRLGWRYVSTNARFALRAVRTGFGEQ